MIGALEPDQPGPAGCVGCGGGQVGLAPTPFPLRTSACSSKKGQPGPAALLFTPLGSALQNLLLIPRGACPAAWRLRNTWRDPWNHSTWLRGSRRGPFG